MARLQGISPGQAGLFTRLIYSFTRRAMREIAGRAELPEPMTLLAHHRKLMMAVARMEMAQGAVNTVPARIKALCGIRAAQLVGCPF